MQIDSVRHPFGPFRQALLLAAVVAWLAGCRGQQADKNPEEAAESRVGVTTAVVEAKEYTPTLRYPGTLQAMRKVNLGTALPGRVEHIHFERGQQVPKGSVIAEMSAEMLVQAEVENQALARDLGRLERLRKKEAVSQMELDHLRARYEASQAKVALLKRNTTIVAPFTGVLTEILVGEGENYAYIPTLTDGLKLENGIVQLQQLNPLKLVLEVNEKDLPRLVKGQKATLTVDAYPGHTLEGRVVFIAPVLSSSSHAADVELSVPNDQGLLKPGMYCQAALQLGQQRGLFVPLRAVYRLPGTGETYLFEIVGDTVAVCVPVVTGQIKGSQIEVQGVEAGVAVALTGKEQLNNGLRPQVTRR